ncbi:TPA: hypothetical protein P7484_002271 [Klebsiella pneumoniae]|nr:hypothetical protein [Klebsiella pneumoniae]HBQ5732623.1 hypothetical protein [Klebsiella pneumoniae subsp. pneumoniae]MBK0711310.1 hypothetical protein [Klebsiella pneumoniae]MCQ3841325.1 toxin [Klebsiella pneumoniae]HBQ7822556.1 hypothetical protein [Klebsiella pneumoniae]
MLEQHYALTLNDTPFCDETFIQEHIGSCKPHASSISVSVTLRKVHGYPDKV